MTEDKKTSEEKKIENPCPNNPEHEYIPMTIWFTDDLGEERDDEVCANCHEDSLEDYRRKIEKASDVDVAEIIGEYNEAIASGSPPRVEGENLQIVRKREYDFIEKYSAVFSEKTNAPLDVCKAMAEFDISAALNTLYFADGMGRIRPNLGFIWLAPSGSYKTPLYEWGITKLHDKLFSEWGYYHFQRIGGRALISSMSHIKVEELKEGRVPALITLDEASTLAKDSNADGLSDTFEAFAQAYDGQLASSNTIIRKHEQPHPCYSPIWFQGTPIFLKYVNEDFWDIGLGNRMFFLRYSISEVKPIPMSMKSKEFYEEITTDLELMKKIKSAKFSDEVWNRYNEYQMSVMKGIQKAETDIESSIDSNNFSVVSRVKIPIHVLKLAIVFSASRFNVDDSGILHVELVDMERAIEEIETYHANMVYIHTIWENQSAQRLKHESIEIVANKIFNHMTRILESGKGVDLTYSKEDDCWVADESVKGKWVRHSMLLKNSHMKAKGLKSFEEVVTTLMEREEIQQRTGRIYKKSNGTRIPSDVIFYRLKE